jgi:ActR/RegA family two-component response regulator
MLKHLVARTLPESEIRVVNDQASFAEQSQEDAVMLINRVLDGGFGSRNGIELISLLRTGSAKAKAILISNYADAQAQAVAAGALCGFGKRELYDEETATLLRSAATVAATDSSAT